MEVQLLSPAPKFATQILPRACRGAPSLFLGFQVRTEKPKNLALPPLPKGWCTYMLVCQDNSFYTGLTNDLPTRILDHANGKGGSYTKSVKPTIFVWYESHPDRKSAAARESQIKNWSHSKKQKIAEESAPFQFGQKVRLYLE